MTARRLEIRVPGIPPGGNALHRMQHWQIRKSRQEWQDRTISAIRASGVRPLSPRISRCHIEATWVFRVRRTRDFDNLIAGLKPLIDGLVLGGILEGDSTDHILAIGGAVRLDKTEGDAVLLTVEEVAGDDGQH